MSKCLMERLDEARGHDGEYDATSYAVATAVHDHLWALLENPERVKLIEQAMERGIVRAYTNPDGSIERRSIRPGAAAAIAAITSP